MTEQLVQLNKKTKYNEFADKNPFENINKLLNHMDRFSAWGQGKDPFPVNIELFGTNYCNFSCFFCVSAFSHIGNPTMTKDEKNKALNHLDTINAISSNPERRKGLDPIYVKKFLKEAKELGLKSITGSGGGEITMWSGFREVMEYAKEIGLEIALMTNGAWNKKDTEFIKDNMKWVRVSLDTFDSVRYRNEKATGLFPKVIENIKNVVGGKAKIGLNCNVGDYNKDEIIEFSVDAKKLGVNYAQYRPILPLWFDTSVNQNYRKPYPKEWVEELKPKLFAAEQLSTDDFKVYISWDKFEGMAMPNFGRLYDKCKYHHFQCVLNADGNLYVCAYRMLEPDKFAFGNIYEQSAEEIWNSEKRKKVVNFCENDLDIERCQVKCKGENINNFIHLIENPKEESDVNFL